MNGFECGEAVLIVAHPGHELVVHGWLETYKPLVAVLTDGSGAGGVSRLDSSVRTIEAAGAKTDEFFGVCRDSDVYTALLAGDTAFFLRLLERLTDLIVAHRPGMIAGDAIEGYNPVHDLCRALINAAVRRAGALGITIGNYDFPVVLPHVAPQAGTDAIVLKLDTNQLSRKLEAACAYRELKDDVSLVLAGRPASSVLNNTQLRRLAESSFIDRGARSVDLECLSSVDGRPPAQMETPFYEYYGEYLASIGRYAKVIRFEEHVAPIFQLLDTSSA